MMRSPYFTVKEVRVLVNLVLGELEVIENRQASLRAKQETWIRIAACYNETPGCAPRKLETLKMRYKNFRNRLAKRIKEAIKNAAGLPFTLSLKEHERDLAVRLKFVDHNIVGCKNNPDMSEHSYSSNDGEATETIQIVSTEQLEDEGGDDDNPIAFITSEIDQSESNSFKVMLNKNSVTSTTAGVASKPLSDSRKLTSSQRELLNHQYECKVQEFSNKNIEHHLVEREAELKIQILEAELEHKRLIIEEFKMECGRKAVLHQLAIEEYKCKLESQRNLNAAC